MATASAREAVALFTNVFGDSNRATRSKYRFLSFLDIGFSELFSKEEILWWWKTGVLRNGSLVLLWWSSRFSFESCLTYLLM